VTGVEVDDNNIVAAFDGHEPIDDVHYRAGIRLDRSLPRPQPIERPAVAMCAAIDRSSDIGRHWRRGKSIVHDRSRKR